MNTPLVSILLPFRDPDPDHFAECLNSIRYQNYSNAELVLVDNGSTEGFSKLIEPYSSHFKVLKLVYESIPGISNALNTGLTYCSGKYVVRMDADDVMLPGRISEQVFHLQNSPDLGAVSGFAYNHSHISSAEGIDYYVDEINSLLLPEDIYSYRFIESPLIHPTITYDMNLIERFGNYSTLPDEPEDYELWLRWLTSGVKISKTNRPVIIWRDTPGRLTRTDSHYTRSSFNKVRMRYLQSFLMSKPMGDRPIWVWGAGKLARQKIKLLLESGVTIAGILELGEHSKYLDIPIVNYNQIPDKSQCYVISLVSNRGVHQQIRSFLEEKGFKVERDFLLCG